MREKLAFDGREADLAPFLFDAVIDHDGDHCGEKIQQDRAGGLHDAAIQTIRESTRASYRPDEPAEAFPLLPANIHEDRHQSQMRVGFHELPRLRFQRHRPCVG